ncbi:hypothetical protein BJ508DRAFT_302942 [Ascobolus immersus RN42]|uniref:Uncharacterized protein n=1 Tax=Ascobolus immersus RN42 TaxID=1160509 RepID=A0A3N4IGK2_ASCIM|nr:hypothetical protein BJ508DRAFT_302942 [Ascobolus immersus RN42]
MHLSVLFLLLTTLTTLTLSAAIPTEATSLKPIYGIPLTGPEAAEWSYKIRSLNPEFTLVTRASGLSEVLTYGSTPAQSTGNDPIRSAVSGQCTTREVSPHTPTVERLLDAFHTASEGRRCIQTSDTAVAVFGVYHSASIVYSARKGRIIPCDYLYRALVSIFATCMLNEKVEGWVNVQYPDGSALVGIALWTGERQDNIIIP